MNMQDTEEAEENSNLYVVECVKAGGEPKFNGNNIFDRCVKFEEQLIEVGK